MRYHLNKSKMSLVPAVIRIMGQVKMLGLLENSLDSHIYNVSFNLME